MKGALNSKSSEAIQ